MAVTKKKVSKARRDKRRSNNSKLTLPGITKCQNCGKYVLAHRVCKNCNTYNGKQVLKEETKKEA